MVDTPENNLSTLGQGRVWFPPVLYVASLSIFILDCCLLPGSSASVLYAIPLVLAVGRLPRRHLFLLMCTIGGLVSLAFVVWAVVDFSWLLLANRLLIVAALGAVVVVVMQRQRSYEALQQSEERYRDLVENINDIIFRIDAEGRILYVSPPVEIVAGYTPEELHGHPFTDLVYPEDLSAILGSFQRILAGQPEPVESRFVIKSGEIRWGRTFARLIVQGDMPVGMQGVISDITERKLAEVEMLRAREAAEEMERVKSDFLASVSHELRTPLNVLMGYAAMLLDGAFGTLTSAQRDPLQRIDKHAQWLFDLVTQVLTLGQIEERRLVAHPVMLQLPDFFHEIAVETRDLQARADLEFVWHIAPDLPAVYTDPGKLKVVMMNLVNNAIKFTPQGRVTVRGQPCNGGVEISVTDTGVGIAPESQTVIFEAFRQGDSLPELRVGGVGIGLHLAKRLVEFLGGTISVESEVGRGATFRVWLPLGKS